MSITYTKSEKEHLCEYISLTSKIKPYYKAFENIIKDPSNFKIVQAVRQSGKTNLIIDLAFAKSQVNSFKTIAICTLNNNMRRLIIDMIREKYEALPLHLKHGIDTLRYTTGPNFVFSNGSSIHVISLENNCCAFRGYALNDIFIDEMAFIQNQKTLDGTMQTIIPCMYGQGNASITIVSTRASRSIKRNVFWRIWTRSIENKSTYGIVFKPFTIRSKDVKHLNRSKLSEMKMNMGRTRYEKEFTIRMK